MSGRAVEPEAKKRGVTGSGIAAETFQAPEPDSNILDVWSRIHFLLFHYC